MSTKEPFKGSVPHARTTLPTSDQLPAFNREETSQPRNARPSELEASEWLRQGNLEAAEQIYRGLIAREARSHRVYSNLAAICGLTGREAEMIGLLKKALEINPEYADAHNNLGVALQRTGDSLAALESFQKATEIDPEREEYQNNLGNILKELGHVQEAIVHYRRALKLRPDYTKAHTNLGLALQEHGDLPAALNSLKKAVSLNPQEADFHKNLSMALLSVGDYSEGWREYEWRLQCDDGPELLTAHPCTQRWAGEPIAADQQILLVAEQGLGDTLQFMRYVLVLRQRGINVRLCAPSSLHGVIHASGLDAHPLTPAQGARYTAGPWLPLLSLPGLLNITPEHPRITDPYIHIPPERVAHWKHILSAECRPIIALHWQGNPEREKTNFKGRSLPLETFASLVAQSNVVFISLQKGHGSEQLLHCSFRDRFVQCQGQIGAIWDFIEIGAILANCDLLISADSAIVHLAGGMGVPTWLLLRQPPEWRWGLEGERSFWYPSLRLFRQRHRGDWPELMQRVSSALRAMNLENPEWQGPRTGADGPAMASTAERLQNMEQNAASLLREGDLKQAEQLYRQLLAEGSCRADVHANLAAIYGKAQRYEEMLLFSRKALDLEPSHAVALYNLAIAYQGKQDLPAARRAYIELLRQIPNHYQALIDLGSIHRRLDAPEAAIDCYRRAIKSRPDEPLAYHKLGVMLGAQGNVRAAIACHEEAIRLKSDYREAHCCLGVAHLEMKQLQAAEASLRRAIDLQSNYPEAHSNLGIALMLQGHMQAALESFRRAVELQPECAEFHFNLGGAHQLRGEMEAAAECYQQAITLKPKQSEYHMNLATALLANGQYREGWQEYEWRFKTREGRRILPPLPPTARWQGEPLAAGQTLLLLAEQGLGDALQFMRYVQTLRDRNIAVRLCAPRNLHGVIKSSGLDSRPLAPERARSYRKGPWMPLLSLPSLLELTPANPLITDPYIKIPEERIHHWRRLLSEERRPIIGLHWQGNPEHETTSAKGRSLPLETFAPLARQTNVQFLSLQKGDGSEQLAGCSFRDRFVQCQALIEPIWDFMEIGAILANCDLLISADSAVIHLAGGMGLPTWLLLRQPPDWRWGLEGTHSFWYPSLRLFRQRQLGDWQELMERVATELSRMVMPSVEPTPTVP